MLLAVGAALAIPIGRWFARPLNELDEVTHAISRGELTERVHDDVGPPELRRLASSFNIMAARLSAMIDRQRGFISYASHQLRTPLASVRLRVENLADVASPADAEEYRLVVDEVDRLSAIFEAVLTFARADTESAELTDIDAGAIADDRVVAWQAMADAARVRLTRAGVDTAAARAAAQTLDQVLDVLVHNAIKAGGVGATVQVVVGRDADEVRIAVCDDGPGMTEEQMAQAMRPFWRQPDRGQAGAGLGLAIANALVTASGGTLQLRRSAAGGLAAEVRLSAAPDRVTEPVE
jgi:signal transduction histidine kinase